jgi:hypothetical protein
MKKTTLGFLIILAVSINTAIWLIFKNHPGIYLENGPMENFQAVCLGLGFLLWLSASFGSANRAKKILLVGLALFHLLFLVNEIDTRKLDMPILTKFLQGRIRNVWLWSLWAAVGFFFFKNAKSVWNEFLHWIKTSSGILMLVSGVFWIASGLNDKALIGRKDLYIEELMEVNSTLLMLLSAIFLLRTKKGNPQPEKRNEQPIETQ